MTTYQPNVVLSNQEFDVVGTRPIRHDGYEKVTGLATPPTPHLQACFTRGC